jgi:hypothetical protein
MDQQTRKGEGTLDHPSTDQAAGELLFLKLQQLIHFKKNTSNEKIMRHTRDLEVELSFGGSNESNESSTVCNSCDSCAAVGIPGVPCRRAALAFR